MTTRSLSPCLALRRAGLALMAALLWPLAALADPALVFGPSPRALDNRAIFAPAHLPDWQALADAGIEAVILNQTFLAATDILPGPRTRRRDRPEGSYLTDADLADLALMLERTGLPLIYAAGLGLETAVCAPDLSPQEAGRAQAEDEWARGLSRLRRAGIRPAALNFDGPFLRWTRDSTKTGSCAVTSGGGGDAARAARTGLAYMAALQDRAEAAWGAPIGLAVTVNLPNWQVGPLHRIGNPQGPATIDLSEVLSEVARALAETPLRIEEVTVDYPYAILRDDPQMFRGKLQGLLEGMRGINGPGQAAPGLGIIVNTQSYPNPCLAAQGPDAVPFLPFRRNGAPIGPECIAAQIGNGDVTPAPDTDVEWMRDTLDYASGLRPGGWIDALLVSGIWPDRLYLQSWGLNPLSNVWYMAQLRQLALSGAR
ncbi:hypothetical protein [Pseudoroseicyclus aestuarii]|uniref:Uncharacterized protein n=1 Tax=Pseudoroseicyclus aestuarii TaxID=1795041 RepID=A0A318SMY5_9RHOB|nr:hypothetical protein [Pseudoroseicyclus aestuarii]PYE82163.1 hypothetical protein DFP88_1053 [Pseudoroseicyclus aestuarii]